MGPGGTRAHSQLSLEPEGRGRGAKAASPSSLHGGPGAPPSPRPRRGPPGTHLSCTSPRQGARAGARSALSSPGTRAPGGGRGAGLGRRARAPPDPTAHDDTSASRSESPRPLPAHLPPPPPPGSRSSRSQQSPARVQGPRRRQEAGRARAPPRPARPRGGGAGPGPPGFGSPAPPPPPPPRPSRLVPPAPAARRASLHSRVPSRRPGPRDKSPRTPTRRLLGSAGARPPLRQHLFPIPPHQASHSSPATLCPHPSPDRNVLPPPLRRPRYFSPPSPGSSKFPVSPGSLACFAPTTSLLSLPHGPLAQFSPYPYRQPFSPHLVRNFKV